MFEHSYRGIIQKAVADLQAAQRSNPFQEPIVWAIPTYGNEAGGVVVTGPGSTPDNRFYTRGPRYMPRVIRPRDNGASTFNSWNAVPYAAQFGVLYQALRREPILSPLPEIASKVSA
jgi:hypothetical protein